MNEPLEALLRAASEADGTNRIEYRDRIAAHGAEVVRRLEPWLRDRRLERFAIVTIAAAGACGATAEARAALRRAQPSDPSAAKAIADALAKLVGTREAKAKTRTYPIGSPASALGELRPSVNAWRDRGRPPQRAIRWRQRDWAAAFPQYRTSLQALPARLDRSYVRRVAVEAVRGPTEAEFAFLVVKTWGEGENGYGPTRALESLNLTPDPGKRLLAVAQRVQYGGGAHAAYALLSDGGECRIFNLGPAFGTKFLYFCQPPTERPRALIHDKNVGDWLHSHAGFPRWSTSWSPGRYRDYLSQMHAWAGELGCEPEDVELCMFRTAVPTSNQWNETEPSTQRPIYRGRAEGWLVVPSLERP